MQLVGPVSAQSLPVMGSQDLACGCIGLIQLTEEADPHLHPYHPSLAEGLMGCPELELQWAEGAKHDECVLLALQWKDWLMFQADKRGAYGGEEENVGIRKSDPDIRPAVLKQEGFHCHSHPCASFLSLYLSFLPPIPLSREVKNIKKNNLIA